MPAQQTQSKCLACEMDFTHDMPYAEVINTPGISMVVYMHPELPKCPFCKALHEYRITGVDQEGKITLGMALVARKGTAQVRPLVSQ